MSNTPFLKSAEQREIDAAVLAVLYKVRVMREVVVLAMLKNEKSKHSINYRY